MFGIGELPKQYNKVETDLHSLQDYCRTPVIIRPKLIIIGSAWEWGMMMYSCKEVLYCWSIFCVQLTSLGT